MSDHLYLLSGIMLFTFFLPVCMAGACLSAKQIDRILASLCAIMCLIGVGWSAVELDTLYSEKDDRIQELELQLYNCTLEGIVEDLEKTLDEMLEEISINNGKRGFA